MTKPKKKKGSRRCSKARLCSLILAVVFVLTQVTTFMEVSAATTIYVDRETGDNSNSGNSPQEAVKSLKRAKKIVGDDGIIYIKKDGKWVAVNKGTDQDKKDLEVGLAGIEAVGDLEEAEDLEKAKNPEVTKAPEVMKKPEVTKTPEATKAPAVTATPAVTQAAANEVKEEPMVTPEVTEAVPVEEDTKVVAKEAMKEQLTETFEVAEEANDIKDEVMVDEVTVGISDDVAVTKEATTNETKAQDETVADEATVTGAEDKATIVEEADDQQGTEEAGDQQDNEDVGVVELPADGIDVTVEDLAAFLEQVTFMIDSSLDANNIIDATKAYEALDEATKAKLPEAAYKRLRAAQIVVGNHNKTSNGITVTGDLPWYVEFRATHGNSKGNGTFDLGELVGAYELVLWNTLTNEPYELNGATVTVTVAVENPAKYKNISIIHYLPDGSHEILQSRRVDGRNAISFETSSFSPYSIAGNELVGNLDKVYDDSKSKTPASSGNSSSGSSSNTSSNRSGKNSSNNSSTNNSSNSNNSSSKSSSNNSSSNSSSSKSVGARTGDSTEVAWLIGVGVVAAGVIVFLKKREKKED